MEAFTKAEKTKKPHWKEMFTDVYQEIPDQLRLALHMGHC